MIFSADVSVGQQAAERVIREGPSLTSHNGKCLCAEGPPGSLGGRRSQDDLPRAEGREKHSSVLWGLIYSQRTMSVPRRHKSQPINSVWSAGFTEPPVNNNSERCTTGDGENDRRCASAMIYCIFN